MITIVGRKSIISMNRAYERFNFYFCSDIATLPVSSALT